MIHHWDLKLGHLVDLAVSLLSHCILSTWLSKPTQSKNRHYLYKQRKKEREGEKEREKERERERGREGEGKRERGREEEREGERHRDRERARASESKRVKQKCEQKKNRRLISDRSTFTPRNTNFWHLILDVAIDELLSKINVSIPIKNSNLSEFTWE